MQNGLLRRWGRLVCASLVGMLTGCGPVDYKVMSPDVWKASSEIFVVDSPAGWQLGAVRQITANAGVWSDVQSVSDANLKGAVDKAVRLHRVGLVVVVVPGTITPQDIALAGPHLSTRFEFIGAAGAPVGGINVRQLVPDGLVTSYQLGWLAGSLAGTQGNNQVGWLTDGNFRLPTTTIKVALAGAYQANGKSSLTVVAPSVIGQTSVSVPHVVLTDMSLTAQQYSWFLQQGILLLSLLPESNSSGPSPAAEPTLPPVSALGTDLAQFAKLKWTSGTSGVAMTPVVVVRAGAIPQSALAGVPDITLSNRSMLDSMWNQLPFAIQLMWSTSLGIPS